MSAGQLTTRLGGGGGRLSRAVRRGVLAAVVAGSGLTVLAASTPAASASTLAGAGLGLGISTSVTPGTVVAGSGTLVTQAIVVTDNQLLGGSNSGSVATGDNGSSGCALLASLLFGCDTDNSSGLLGGILGGGSGGDGDLLGGILGNSATGGGLGLLDATGVSVTESLPTGETLVSADPVTGLDPDGFTCATSSNTVACAPSDGTIFAGNSDTIDVTFTVDASVTPTTLADTATVTGNVLSVANVLAVGDLLNLASASASAYVSVVPGEVVVGQPNLGVSIAPSNQGVAAGAGFSQTVTVSNGGAVDAANPQLVYSIPAGETFNGYTMVSNPDGFACTAGPITGPASVTCSADTLPSGSSDSANFDLTVGAAVVNGSVLANAATLSSSTAGSNIAHASGRVTVSNVVGPNPDLALSISPHHQHVAAGNSFAQLVTVSASGTNSAANPDLTFDLVGGETFQGLTNSVDPDGFACTSTTTQVTCTATTLAAGSTDSADFNFIVPIGTANGPYTNHATLTSTTATADTASASANFTVYAAPPPTALRVHISPPYQTVTAGAGPNVVQRVTITNFGGTDATGVNLAYTIAGVETYDSAVSASGITCAATGALLNCSPPGGVLPANTSESVTLTFDVHSPAVHQTFVNHATLTSTLPGTATASATVTVKRSPTYGRRRHLGAIPRF